MLWYFLPSAEVRISDSSYAICSYCRKESHNIIISAFQQILSILADHRPFACKKPTMCAKLSGPLLWAAIECPAPAAMYVWLPLDAAG